MFKCRILVCFLLGVFRKFSHPLSLEKQLTRNFFDNTLPLHSLYYVNVFEGVSQDECALHCLILKSACVGILYNKELFSCKLTKCYLNERSIDRNRADIGWKSWFQNNVCPDGWFPFDQHCYSFNETPHKWDNAKEQCEQYGAYLVEIDSFAENVWIMEAFLPAWNNGDCSNWTKCCNFWIGATDIDDEGIFTWNHHTNVTFSNWRNNQPNNWGGRENCVEICRNGFWNDDNCNFNSAFICEKEF